MRSSSFHDLVDDAVRESAEEESAAISAKYGAEQRIGQDEIGRPFKLGDKRGQVRCLPLACRTRLRRAVRQAPVRQRRASLHRRAYLGKRVGNRDELRCAAFDVRNPALDFGGPRIFDLGVFVEAGEQ